MLFLLLFCSSKSENELTIWHQMFPGERPLLDSVLTEFMSEYPDIKVYHVYYETEELRSNFIISSLGGSGPDLIHGPSDQVGPFEVMEIIKPLEGLFEQDYLKSFDPKALTWRNGHLYQIGDQIGNHLTLVYNKKLIENPPETTDELIKFGLEFTKDLNGDGIPDRFALAWNFIEPFFFIPFIGGFGGWVMDENENPTLNTPEIVNAFKFILDLKNKYKIIPRECDLDMADMLFKQEKAAMLINGPWSWGGYIRYGMDIGLTRIPKISETGLWPAPMVSPRGYSINANLRGEKLEKTLTLLKFLLRIESQLKYTKYLGTIPSRTEAFNSPVVKQNEILKQSIYQLEVGKPMPVSPNMRAVWDAMRPSYQALLNGTKTPEEAAEQMQREALRKIREMMR